MTTISRRHMRDLTTEDLWELVAANPAVTYLAELGGELAPIFVSEGVTTWLGWEPQQFLDDRGFFLRHIHPDDRARVLAEADALTGGGQVVIEYRYRHRDGHFRWVRDTARTVFDGAGRPRRVVGYWVDIDDARRAEAALRDSEQQLRLVTDAVPVLIDDIDRDLRYRFANGAYAKWFGLAVEKVTGGKVREVLGDQAYKVLFPYMQRALEGEEASFEATLSFKHGPARHIQVNYVPKLDSQGNVGGFRSVIADVGDRRRAEIARRETEDRLRLLADSVPVLINYVDRDLRYRLNNRAYYDWFGVTPEHLQGRSVPDFLGPEAFAAVRLYLERALAGEAVRFEATMPYRHGERRHVQTSFVPHFGDEGKVEGVFAVVADISERHRHEKDLQKAHDELERRVRRRTADIEATNLALRLEIAEREKAEGESRKSGARYRRLYEGAPVMMHSIDRHGRLVRVNDAWLQALGYDRDEVIGEDITKLMVDADTRRWFKDTVLPGFLATGVAKDVQYRLLAKSGEAIDVEVSAFAERDDSGSVASSIAVLIDVTARNRAEQEIRRLNALLEARVAQRTAELHRANRDLREEIEERKLAEAALRESEDILRTVIEGASGPIFFKDAAGYYRMVNTAGAIAVGLQREEMIGKRDIDLMPPQFAEEFRSKDLEIMAAGGTRTYEEPFGTVHGERRMLTTKSVVHRADGELLGIVGVAQDITEQREAEAKIRSHQAEIAHVARVSTMGEMATTLAHELNQPLTAVVNYARGSIRRLRALDDANLSEILRVQEQIAAQAERAGEVIGHIRKFVRKAGDPSQRSSINAIVGATADLVEIDAREQGVTLEFGLQPDLPMVSVDVIEIEQVLLNLIRNGMDSYKQARVAKPRILVRSGISRSGDIEVAVVDWGRGLPKESTERVFDPFFTTKEDGMGMGLSISRTIVEAHGGALWASRNDGRGTTFRFTLPVRPA